MSAPLTVGVLGGTFDPVHLGHLQIAEHVRRSLDLGRMLMLLSPRPPHKSVEELSPADHREAMLRLALLDHPDLELCRLELEHPERVGYTLDSLRSLSAMHGGVRPVFVMGFDALAELPTWREYRSLMAEFDLVAIERPGAESGTGALDPEVAARIQRLPIQPDVEAGRGGRIFVLPMETIDISSSQIRARVARGASLAELVPPAVARYIQDQFLYGPVPEKRRRRRKP